MTSKDDKCRLLQADKVRAYNKFCDVAFATTSTRENSTVHTATLLSLSATFS